MAANRPARRCNTHPRELAANPKMSPGAGDEAGQRPSSPILVSGRVLTALCTQAGQCGCSGSWVGTTGAGQPPR